MNPHLQGHPEIATVSIVYTPDTVPVKHATRAVVTITGDFDAYGTVSYPQSIDCNGSAPDEPNIRCYEVPMLNDAGSIGLEGAIDPDCQLDTLAISVEVFDGTESLGSGATSLDVVDEDVPLTVSLSTLDGQGVEPHGFYYLAQSPTDVGQIKLDFSEVWPGGTINLLIDDDDVFGAGYTLASSDAALSHTGNSLEVTPYSGRESVVINVIPTTDDNENDPDQTVSFSFDDPPWSTFVEGCDSASGTASVDIDDVLEGLDFAADPDETYEYNTGPDFAAFLITPDHSGEKMKGMVHLEIDASSYGSATPGVDYVLYHVESDTYLQFYLLDPLSDDEIYYTDSFSVDGLTESSVEVQPVDDLLLEDDETIDATLIAGPRFTGDTREHGEATVTIIDEYFVAPFYNDPDPECSCTCVCAGVPSVSPKDGAPSVTDQANIVSFTADTNGSQSPVIRGSMPMPQGKAIPTSLSFQVQTILPDKDESDALRGLGRIPDAALLSFTMPVTPGMFDGDTLNIALQPDLEGLLPEGSRIGTLDIELLIHPDFELTATNEEKFSGWVGRYNHIMTDRTVGGLSIGHAPGLAIRGVSRAIPDAKVLVPSSSGKVGEVQWQNGFALVEADGSTVWFEGGSQTPPQSMLTKIGNTITDRYNAQQVFDSSGNLTQRVDPQGNVTTYVHDSYGRTTSVTDSIGNTTTWSYLDGGVQAGEEADTIVMTDPFGRQSTYVSPSTGAPMTITHADPDGAGPRKALVETWTFSDGLLTGIAYSEESGSSLGRSTTFSYDVGPGSTGTRRMTSMSRTDGATTTLVRSAEHEGAITAEIVNSGTYFNPNIAAMWQLVKPRTSFDNQTVISESVDGLSRTTVYEVAPGGHVRAVLDPIQTERIFGGNVPLLADRTTLQASMQQGLSWRYSFADPSRDDYGNYLGQYYGLVESITSPDPDWIVSNGTTLTNGARAAQITQASYTNGNRTSIQLPSLIAQPSAFNETFDVMTSSTDEHGNLMTQVVSMPMA
ncbi:hypothetical protein N9N28_04140 [Rubripirellula amarantea]|nr:hypothetical protein [Rubripirellula amarantea]